MSPLKELYNDSLKDVIKQAEIPEKYLQVESKNLCKSAMEIYLAAQSADRDGDEEQAYILYMHYASIVEMIRKRDNFLENKVELIRLYGGIDILYDAIGQLDKLQGHLIKRFEERDNSQSSLVTLLVNPGFVWYWELRAMIQEGQNNVLIIDCRPEEDYNQSKLKYKHCVNVPEQIIQVGMTARKIRSELSNESKKLWDYRKIKKQVILMDWDSRHNKLNSKMSTLKSILLNCDPGRTYKSPILILNEGYEAFMIFYPSLTTTSN